MAEEANQEVVETNPEEGNQDELSSILDALEQDDSVATDKKEAPSEEKKGDEPPEEKKGDEPFKKVGTLVFKTEADYDAWAVKNNGEVSRLSGELKKAREAASKNPTDKTKMDVQAIRMQIKVADFFEANPDAVEHKDVIAALLRSGKAKNLDEAKTMALRAMGTEDKKDEADDTKNILKAGGGDSAGSGSYNTNEDVKGVSEFADSALLGKY
jgi:hypothetical protein